MVLQVVSCAESLVAQVQQHIHSEQETNPVVSDSIRAQFDDKGKLLQLAEQLGDFNIPCPCVCEFVLFRCGVLGLGFFLCVGECGSKHGPHSRPSLLAETCPAHWVTSIFISRPV